jgi:uncharacterized protein with HEPN domain
LQHIIDAVGTNEEYVRGLDEQSFFKNRLVQDAVIRQFEIIGEAVKQLSSQLRNRHKEIPWQQMAGMRDKLIHEYFGVNVDQVWMTVTEDIPRLKNDLPQVLESL